MTLGWFAVMAQLVLMLENRVVDISETIIRFFSFFTILTNILVTLYFTSIFFRLTKGPFSVFTQKSALTALTAFILLVGIVYQIVLRSIWEPTGLQMIVDELLHTIIPLYVLIYWYRFTQLDALNFSATLVWLAYPLVYFIFIIIRGHFSGFYPYPFVDVLKIGYGTLAVNFLLILGLLIILMAILVFIGNRKTGSNS